MKYNTIASKNVWVMEKALVVLGIAFQSMDVITNQPTNHELIHILNSV